MLFHPAAEPQLWPIDAAGAAAATWAAIPASPGIIFSHSNHGSPSLAPARQTRASCPTRLLALNVTNAGISAPSLAGA
jgi:hypothetical protein